MKDCRGQLLQRIRQGLASGQDETAFEAHLDSCESCRMTLDLMGAFDAVDEPAPGDSARVAQMAKAGVATFGKSAPRPRPSARRTWQLTAAAMILTGAAAAGVVAARRASDTSAGAARTAGLSTSERKSTAPLAPAAAKKAPAKEPTAAAPPATDSLATDSLAPDLPAAESPQRVDAPTAAPAKTSATAAAMYRAANDARRAGKTSEAILGYRKLQAQFPNSPEAHASRVSLGGALLRSGSSSAAVAQFDAYLASSGGQLTAEALFGRAQALRALGRTAEEGQDLNRLVGTYPNSAYANHAERRLLELR